MEHGLAAAQIAVTHPRRAARSSCCACFGGVVRERCEERLGALLHARSRTWRRAGGAPPRARWLARPARSTPRSAHDRRFVVCTVIEGWQEARQAPAEPLVLRIVASASNCARSRRAFSMTPAAAMRRPAGCSGSRLSTKEVEQIAGDQAPRPSRTASSASSRTVRRGRSGACQLDERLPEPGSPASFEGGAARRPATAWRAMVGVRVAERRDDRRHPRVRQLFERASCAIARERDHTGSRGAVADAFRASRAWIAGSLGRTGQA